MKAFFISDRKNSELHKMHALIIKTLEEEGFKIDKTHYDRPSDKDAEELQTAYQKYMKSIKNADVLVAEVTELSSGVGFMIANALGQKKPVLALFNPDFNTKPSKTIIGSNNKYLNYKEYNNNLSKIIKDFMIEVKGMLDTKFILIIPPEIDKYLEWSSDTKRMHKAQIVRRAIEKQMDLDDEWQELS